MIGDDTDQDSFLHHGLVLFTVLLKDNDRRSVSIPDGIGKAERHSVRFFRSMFNVHITGTSLPDALESPNLFYQSSL